jgi:PAT family beta-lactamase induction signal transducer AmpG
MKPTKNPWLWVPTLYFAEVIPYFLVNTISVVMFTDMGMPNGQMALYTSLLYLPWVIKPLWSPFVDLIKNKHWWIMAMQILMSLAMMLLPFLLPQGPGTAFASSPLFFTTLALFWITAFASATHDIAADGFYMLALDSNKQAEFVGIRSTFYRLSSIFGQGVLVALAGILDRYTDVHVAWQITLILAAIIFAGVTLYHTWHLPKPANDKLNEVRSAKDIFKEFGRTFATFFQKKYIWLALAFMLLYRLPEAFLVKMINPFMLNPIADGGLGMTKEEVGLIYGTIGIAALTLGGILGGIAASKWGLKKSLWPMALSLALPCLSFVFLAMFQPDNNWVIGSCVALDQFGYGFGFTAYMLYLIYFSEGDFKTAHYSICTAFMALSMMLPGLVAGYVQEWLGYTNFFIFVMICCLATVFVTLKIKVDPEFGKKQNQ